MWCSPFEFAAAVELKDQYHMTFSEVNQHYMGSWFTGYFHLLGVQMPVHWDLIDVACYNSVVILTQGVCSLKMADVERLMASSMMMSSLKAKARKVLVEAREKVSSTHCRTADW